MIQYLVLFCIIAAGSGISLFAGKKGSMPLFVIGLLIIVVGITFLLARIVTTMTFLNLISYVEYFANWLITQ